MVLNRRLEYGFNGYQVPAMPRAARSARRRGSPNKKVEDNNMCAFDLLATVAGKLLVGKDSSPSSSNLSTKQDQCAITVGNIKEEFQAPQKQLELQPYDQGSGDMICLGPKLVPDYHNPVNSFKEANKDALGCADTIVNSDGSGGLASEKLGKDEMRYFAEKVTLGSVEHGKPSNYNSEDETKRKNVVELLNSGNAPHGTGANMYSAIGDQVVWDAKPLVQISSYSNAKMSFKETEEPGPRNLFSQVRDNVALDSKDDDENSSGCTHRSTTKNSFKPAPCMGDRRIRKVLASKYWKVATKWKEKLFSRNDVDLKADGFDKKSFYKRQRSQRNFPFKKRKFFDLNCESNSDGEISGDSCADREMPSVAGQHSPYQSANPHVRVRIESFRVPELFIEIPETATVGSLKRTVMEAVTAILGGELRVGVVLQGKKVGDDSKTLAQTGICHGNNQVDALGFTLEPNSSQDLRSATPRSSPSLVRRNTSYPHSRYPPARTEAREGIFDEPQAVNNLGNSAESDRGSATSPTDLSNKGLADSKALVPVSALNRETLAVVPVRRKSKHSEIAQRRIRRPFSVAEVEALVQAVEKLGTGRWRDVKLRAFDSVKHRTYVDLKDKWKTLVHTARISPQQRRGEPVPQELLDRVLTAHAYWSQQQAKQQLKHHHRRHHHHHHQPETRLLL
ncbi:hypothetical protein CDL15_Pgr010434 [Punica granatum]|uniref:Uncharacterized protein n=2 Tax=Punica granatum TaxID=22663 RepID=A0A218W3G4_PUNGR|nr:hypothetical protein CDL15_Pgr010434 [Punica granatum]